MLSLSAACGFALGGTLWIGIGTAHADEVVSTLPEIKIITPYSSAVSAPETNLMTITVIDGGKETDRDVSLPENATVAQALEAVGVAMGQYDRLYPTLETRVYPQMRIRVTRVEIETKTRTANFTDGGSVRYKPTTSLKAGQEKVLDAGTPGKVEITERVWSKDGKVTLREELSRKITLAPEGKIIGLGVRSYYKPGAIPYHNRYARSYSLSSRGGSPRDRMRAAAQSETLKPVRSITLTATGYSPDPRENGGYTRTATGLPIGYGAAAVDPRVIPLGTKMYVEGYGYAFACDVGGAIKGNRIDLAYDSYRLANTKGRKKVRVWILAPSED